LKSEFKKAGAVVVGVSPDSAKSHTGFMEKQGLDLILLSDPEHVALEAYGAWQLKKMYGREYMGVVRSTVLIDPKGVIQHVWPKVKVKGHAEEVLAKLKELK
jgi:peroxiredoxin Q/BCP